MYLLSYIFIFFIIIWPKVNIIGVPGSNTGIRAEDLFIAVLFFINVFILIKNKKQKILYEDRISLTWLIFIAWGLIVTGGGYLIFHSANIKFGLLYLGRFIEFYTVYLFVRTNFSERKKIPIIFIVIIVAAVLTLIYGFLQQYDMVPYYSTLQSIYDPEAGGFTKASNIKFSMVGVIMSTFGGHYDFGIFLVFIICFLIASAVVLIKNYRWKLIKKDFLYIPAALSLFFFSLIYCIIYAGSRSAYLALLIIFIIAAIKYARYFALIPFIILTVLGFKFFRGKLSNLPGEITLAGITLKVDLSTVIRLEKWKGLFLGNSPLLICLGMGLSSQGEAMDGYYVRLLGETGIAGLFLFALLMFYILRDSRRLGFYYECSSYEEILGKGLFWGTIALLIQGIFIDTFVSSKIMYIFWFMVGLMSGAKEVSVNRLL